MRLIQLIAICFVFKNALALVCYKCSKCSNTATNKDTVTCTVTETNCFYGLNADKTVDQGCTAETGAALGAKYNSFNLCFGEDKCNKDENAAATQATTTAAKTTTAPAATTTAAATTTVAPAVTTTAAGKTTTTSRTTTTSFSAGSKLTPKNIFNILFSIIFLVNFFKK